MAGSSDPGFGSPSPPPKVRLAKGQEVSLGCGTLILIALIVIIFGNARQPARVDNKPVLEKLEAIERRLEAIERRLPKPKAPLEDK